jgi:hypothetical protein
MPFTNMHGLELADLRGENPSPDTRVSLVTMPQGTRVYGFEHAKMELDFILSEMSDDEYFRHGIHIPAGGVVVDVGKCFCLTVTCHLSLSPR